MKSKIVISETGNSVFKTCRSKQELANELQVYRLQLDFVPQLIDVHKGNVIEIQRISGTNLSDDIELDYKLFAEMFATLHAKSSLVSDAETCYDETDNNQNRVICHIDTNPRNYLIRDIDGKYFFIDFSESVYSLPENDLVNFLLFWAASFEPIRFQKALMQFLVCYPEKSLLNINRKPLFQNWIEVFDNRRKRFGKTVSQTPEWQKENRELLIDRFYHYALTWTSRGV